MALVPNINLFRAFGANSRFSDSKRKNKDKCIEVE